MSGLQPNTRKIKNRDMPTDNPFWANINQEGPIQNDGDKTATDQSSQAEFDGTKKVDSQKAPETIKKQIKKCYSCGAYDHTKKFCPDRDAMIAKFKYVKKPDNTTASSANDGDATITDQTSEQKQSDKKNQGSKKSKPKTCYKCHSFNHIRKNCPKKKNTFDKDIPTSSDNVDDKSEQTVEQGKPVNETATKQGQNAVKSNLTIKCWNCKVLGQHTTKACPSNPRTLKEVVIETSTSTAKKAADSKTKNDTSTDDDLKKGIKCHICNTQGVHSTAACPKHPLNKNKTTDAKLVKGKPNEKMIQEQKCGYCDVEGHSIQNCPVKNWGKGPGAESSEDKGKSSKDMAAQSATPNIKLLAEQKQPASTTANVEKPLPGKAIPIRTAATQDLTIKQKAMIQRQKRMEEHKALYTKMLQAQRVLNANAPNLASPYIQSAGVPSMSSAVAPNMTRPIVPNIPSAAVPNIASLPHVQYPGFPTMPKPVQRAPVPVAIPNHPNPAVKTPLPRGHVNKPGTRTLTPVVTPVNNNSVQKESNEPNTESVNSMHRFNTIRHFPAGVPKSFLAKDYRENMLQYEMERNAMKEKEIALQDALKNVNKVPVLVHSAKGFGDIFQMVPDPKEVSKFLPIQSEESMDSDQPKAYSPSDVYGDIRNENSSAEPHEGSESPDPQGQKRLSAFQRLGPVTAPKKPKLTINLKCNAEEPVREVVDETEEEYIEEHTPVHLRNNVTTSTDETVMKYLFFWPWKKAVPVRRTVSFKSSKSAMLLEQEQMEESYDKDNSFIQITITNYPRNWTKEDVIDVLLEQVTIIPCFIEFTSKECKFLVIRSKPALLAIHKMGFKLRKDDVELNLSISLTLITQNQIDFLPRLVLRRRLNLAYDGENKLDLQEFTLKSDLSHFIYFPLNRISNQADLVQLQSVVDWERLTELNLSHNRLTSIQGFHLNSTTPNLKKLDLSYNHFEKVTSLIRCRNLPLRSISFEGNPLCHDYTDPAEYVKIVRMLFPTVRELDGVPLHLKGDLPSFKKNFCLYGAENIVEKYLETFFPLLEAPPSDRVMIDDMYDENALLSVMYRFKFVHRLFRISSINSHFVDDGLKDVIEGASSIMKYVNKWPGLKHDPFTFTVDVLFHSDTATIVKISGILKLTSDTLAEDEPVISFSRTTLLRTTDGVEYKILNEMLLFDEPTTECHDSAFQVTKIRSKKLYIDLEFETTPDDESKEKLIAIFSHLTELDRNASRRCLEKKDWNLKSALDNFIQLLKLNDLSPLINAPTSR